MNYDRLSTRVWDKKEKKMLYMGGVIKTEHYESTYQGVRHNDIIISVSITGYGGETTGAINFIPFGDRFVPMLCSGFREDYEYVEDGMPVFEFDIIQSHMAELFLIVLKDGCWVANLIRDKKIINRPICDLASLEGRFTIKGNKWENPELLEQDE